MEYISVFDMLKIGVGPSSSHTLGPWRAAQRWLRQLETLGLFESLSEVRIDLYGSLSLTGKGHATDIAIMLGLSGYDPEQIDTSTIDAIIQEITETKSLTLAEQKKIAFEPDSHVQFHSDFLPFHANGMRFTCMKDGKVLNSESYYSIGGGFVVQEQNDDQAVEYQNANDYPFPIRTAEELAAYCKETGHSVSEIVLKNELILRSAQDIDDQLKSLWNTILNSVYQGCHSEGVLPGGLNVRRRAFDIYQSLKGDQPYSSPSEWIDSIRGTEVAFRQILKWVGCFAISVNEVNASLGRVVTAPTNGSAGVIPAVLMYYLTIENHNAGFEEIKRFLLVAGEIGSIFKKGSTISAAMGGCQAEIGVSSAMAAGALTELLGGTPDQVMIAAEIAMEHHLGLTCDPVGGLVQVPCIERNSMGAIKAINAAELAIDTNPENVVVPLDQVINTMWETAQDMNTKYKETSQGGLAVRVSLADC